MDWQGKSIETLSRREIVHLTASYVFTYSAGIGLFRLHSVVVMRHAAGYLIECPTTMGLSAGSVLP